MDLELIAIEPLRDVDLGGHIIITVEQRANWFEQVFQKRQAVTRREYIGGGLDWTEINGDPDINPDSELAHWLKEKWRLFQLAQAYGASVKNATTMAGKRTIR